MDPITAAYAQDDADWTITVTGQGKTLTARAPGIIAARDRVDQLVEKLAPAQDGRTVVHLLNGSALDFTATYMQARLTMPPVAQEPKAPAKATKTAEPKKPRKSPSGQAKPAATRQRRTKPAARRTTKPTTDEGAAGKTAAAKNEEAGVPNDAVPAQAGASGGGAKSAAKASQPQT